MLKIFTDVWDNIREIQKNLDAFAEENDGDITDFPLMDLLNDLKTQSKEREKFFCNLACLSLEYEAEADALEAQAKTILERAKKIKHKNASIRNFILENIGSFEKIKDDRVTIGTRKSQSVDVSLPPEELPFEFTRVSVDADKAKIKKALEDGSEISGCSIITRYNLQIK